jgi:hypothetical protein
MKRILLFAALVAWSGMASAVVYKWVDAKGEVQYGDRPPDGVHAEVVEILGTHSGHAAADKPADPVRSTRAPTAAQTAQDDAAKKAIDADVAQTKEKECADAQDRYKKLIEGRRLYKTGPDGERQYLTSEEIDTQRLDAKRELDTICNSPT